MKLITLNIWGGHIEAPLLSFFKAHQDIDIFCLQEVYHNAPDKISTEDRTHHLNIFSEIQTCLPNHQGYFRPAVAGIYGIAIFVSKKLKIVGEGEISIHDNADYPGRGPTHSRNLQWVKFRAQDQDYTVLNVHGLWNGKGKTDTPERIAQSTRIHNFMQTVTGPKILCGDFNLRPETESVQILEEGMENLIKTHGIQSTRTSLYTKDERFADYVFVSPEVKVSHFEVMPDEVSDHSPLLLEFN